MTAELDALVWGALMPGVRELPVPSWLAGALDRGVESICLFADATGTPAQTAAAVLGLRLARPDVLIATDEEAGEVTRIQALRGSTFLSPLALGAIDDPSVTAAQGRLVGRLMRSVGLDWTLAPVCDINTDPRNPVIGVRSFGTDPVRVGEHVAAWLDGVQSAGIACSAKHFPGHGDTHIDSHESLPLVDADIATLKDRELQPFRAAIATGVGSVMTGHILVPALDPNQPASLSHLTTTGLLRNALGYDGVIITDAVEMGAVAGPDRARLASAAVLALQAGADLVCIGAADQEVALADCAAEVSAAVARGQLSPELLAAAGGRRARLRDRAVPDLPDPLADEQALADAAARSLTIHGDARLGDGPVAVVRAAAGPGYAAGRTGWGVAPVLAQHGREVRWLSVDDALAAGEAAGQALVIETRDAWKDPDVMTALRGLIAAHPRAVVVDTGWPLDPLPDVRGWITTRGTGRLSSALAAAALLGADAGAVALDVIRSARKEES